LNVLVEYGTQPLLGDHTTAMRGIFESLSIPRITQKTIKDKKGPNISSPRPATVIAHRERVNQWSVRPIVTAVVVVVVLEIWL